MQEFGMLLTAGLFARSVPHELHVHFVSHYLSSSKVKMLTPLQGVRQKVSGNVLRKTASVTVTLRLT